MARYALIDGYLDTMREEIRWRRDLDDLVSEMEDHLYSTVENLLATGLEANTAQRTTLDRFGEPKLLAEVYASNNSGGIAVPTQNTIRAGYFALASGGLWLFAAAVVAAADLFTDSWESAYFLLSTAVFLAGALGLIAMIGVGKRLGGLGILGMIGLGITGLGVAASILAWALAFWMGLQGVGLVVFGVAVLQRGIAPRWATALASSGFIVGVVLFVGLTAAKVGQVDEYGDYPRAWEIAGFVGMAMVALGFIGWGLWLRSEKAIDIDNDSTPIAA
jgi:hypothetical protein